LSQSVPTPEPAASTDRERFELAWAGFTAAVRRARSRAANRPGASLTPAQFHLLSALEGGSALTVGELAGAAGVSSPTATRMLDALERDGIVTREHSTADRRRISVRTTAAGRRALASGRRRVDAARERIYAELSPDERAQAERLLARLAEAVEQI
jgi:MarR family transcriptional regulator, organic hydroperoxide resistance regulator